MTVYDSLVRFAGVSQVTATLGANDPEIGTIIQEGDEKYLFVYNTGSSTIGTGYGATLSAVSNYSVTVSSVTQTDFPVGVCKHASIPTGSYGWLLLRGFVNVQMTASESAASGDRLCLGVDGGWGRKSNSTDYITPTVGKAMTAIASGGSGLAFITIY